MKTKKKEVEEKKRNGNKASRCPRSIDDRKIEFARSAARHARLRYATRKDVVGNVAGALADGIEENHR